MGTSCHRAQNRAAKLFLEQTLNTTISVDMDILR